MSKVIIQECPSYELTELTAKINAGLNELGGWDRFIRPGMKVLLKVNLIGPKASETAAVTHAELVRALARILKARGCTVWIGDSAGGAIAGIAPTAKAFEVSGLKKVADEEGVALKNFDREGVFAVSPRRDPNQKMYLAKPLFDADLVLNLPKLKTHSGCSYTGAIKNLFGCIPGLRKAEYHKLAPSTRQLGEVLANIHQCSKVDLHIMDAVTAMDGRGPTSGTVYHAGKILISADPLALDTVAAKMIGLDITKIPFFDAARARNLGCFELAKIEIAGDYQSIPVLHGFKLPRPVDTGNRSSKILGKIIDFFKTRPIVNVSLCKQCNVCVNSCPVQVIDRETKKIDYSKCIECLCCHELCMYHAIILKNDNRIAAILTGLFRLN
jgi:uncharacterized protein (DUF362 family)/Pyruvate/2-oxoacid:ferredoxin oxidoreductase delta subunit